MINKEMFEWFNLFKEPDKPMKIYYTSDAYAKTIVLVRESPQEIGWNMVIKPYKDGYLVSDILVYPQKVSPAYIEVDPGKYGLWKAGLTDEQDTNLFGHGHSHVNMSVGASSTDIRQQYEETKLKKSGFFFFQIWNRQNMVSSFFYDLENMVLYRTSDIEITVEFNNESQKEYMEKCLQNIRTESMVDQNELEQIF